MKGRGDGWQKDNYETVFRVLRLFFYTTRIRVRSRYRPPSVGVHALRSDGMDEMGDANRTLFWVTHRTTGRGIQTMMIGHSHNGQNSRRAANVERGGRPAVNRIPEEAGVHRDSWWDSPRKRALFTSDGPDSTMSGIITFRRATQIGLRR